MKKRNLLVVPEAEKLVQQFKEEIAHEFGIFRSTLEMDAVSREMTQKLTKKKDTNVKKDGGKDEKKA
ncbi:small, acid-soluble spore protein, alpha/beta type [Bacillus alkalicellulosilyticus]|uniref:small, acid-soluble spore protein, alpha/beta type n=1 Tax=Alkalihalobacterium alkalicellulosilyticum TaxID=1912214 RepID=UPI0009975717|nr:small, acid-soluble spore protein, alpha/beta type [Bacillus alkalicellulosilyticus]